MTKVSDVAAEQYNKMLKLWNGDDIVEITIASADWTVSVLEGFNYQNSVTKAGITAETDLMVRVKNSDLDKASISNLSVVVGTDEDTIIFYADKKPTANITAYYKVVTA